MSFLCSSADGHLGCFQIWALMNNAAVSIHIQVSVQMYVSFLLEGHKEKSLGPVVVTLGVTFEGLSDCFLKQLHQCRVLCTVQTNSINSFPVSRR